MVATLTMLAKLATVGLLKIKVIQNKIYDSIVSVYYVANKTLSRDSNYIADLTI